MKCDRDASTSPTCECMWSIGIRLSKNFSRKANAKVIKKKQVL